MLEIFSFSTKYPRDFYDLSIKNFSTTLLLALQFDLAWKIEIYMDLIFASTDGAARRAGISPLMRFNIWLDKENSSGRAWKSLTLFPGFLHRSRIIATSHIRDAQTVVSALARTHVLKPPSVSQLWLVIPPVSSGWSRSSFTNRKNVTLLRRHMAGIQEPKRVVATVLLYITRWMLWKWTKERRLRTRKFIHALMHTCIAADKPDRNRWNR